MVLPTRTIKFDPFGEKDWQKKVSTKFKKRLDKRELKCYNKDTEREVMRMNWNLFILFCVLNVLNVVIQTVKSLATINCGKTVAALVNAVAYGLYTVVVVYTVCDLPLWTKVIVVALANLIGVFVVKLFEEKSRKDKLWKVEATIPAKWQNAVHFDLKDVPHSYIEIGDYTIFNFYCATQQDSAKVRDIINQYEAKYFVSESKNL